MGRLKRRGRVCRRLFHTEALSASWHSPISRIACCGFGPWFLGLGSAAVYCVIAFWSRSSQGIGLIPFAGFMSIASMVYLLAYVSGERSAIPSRTVWFWALLFRVVGFYGEPLFEDDHYRYLWDGFRYAAAGTPYGVAPEAFFADPSIPESFRPILGQINHPDIPTIYAPVFQQVFRLAYWLAPGQLWSLKLILIGVDLFLVGLLFRLASPHHVLLYAWNPLVIKEIAFTAHPDGLVGFFLIACWVLITNGKRLVAGLALAAATASKVAAWVLVPFLGVHLGLAGLFALLAGWAGSYLPFWLAGATDAEGLRVFAASFEFNSALYGLARLGLPAGWAKVAMGGVFTLVLILHFFRYRRMRAPSLPRGDWLLGGLLFVSPVVNPWYLLWLLPFATVYPRLTVWVSSVAVLLSYTTGLNLDAPHLAPYEHPPWVRPLEFGLIGLALIADRFLLRPRTPGSSRVDNNRTAPPREPR